MSTYTLQKNTISFIVLVTFSLLLVACSSTNTTKNNEQSIDDTKEIASQDSSGNVMIVDHAGRELTFAEPPQRIVSLSQADMEIVHALGGEIVGRPTSQGPVQPEELTNAEEVGNAHEMDFEKILSLKPDLVIGHARLNMKDVGTVESLGLNMLLTSMDSYEDIIESIGMYGDILALQTEAEVLIKSIEERKVSILSEGYDNEIKALIVFGTTESMMAALPTSLAGNLVDLVGITNIASDLPGIERYPNYAQLSMERVLSANPDVIYFIAHGDGEAVKGKFEEELKSNAAWSNVNAMKNDNLVVLPAELFSSNPGPRIVDALEFLQKSIRSIGK
ncbi:MAG: ABC transporter substrate-binding protein [Bacillaceae bacterium]|nr:ABC transporter substrate-binding protein [Bacillaceae bacterium]